MRLPEATYLRTEVRKSGVAHIEKALTLVNGDLNQDRLEQAQDHLIRAIMCFHALLRTERVAG
jgi:hypothetical protein